MAAFHPRAKPTVEDSHEAGGVQYPWLGIHLHSVQCPRLGSHMDSLSIAEWGSSDIRGDCNGHGCRPDERETAMVSLSQTAYTFGHQV